MIGVDFGTTNCAAAWIDASGESHLVAFPDGDSFTSTFRSVLFFDEEAQSKTKRPEPQTGPGAILAYIDSGARGRLLLSLKSQLGSKVFRETFLFGWKFTLQELVALLLRDLRSAAMRASGDPCTAVVLGRPVHFVAGSDDLVDDASDTLALSRLREAALLAGFEEVRFAYEPLAAAFAYEQRLEQDELCLIADFGGGTSDFCLVELGPGPRACADRRQHIRGISGVPRAGGAFDGKIIRSAVAPRLGLGSRRRTAFGKLLPAPVWIYRRLERWEDLSFLKSRETLQTLEQLQHESLVPRQIAALRHLVEDDLGYSLYQAVEGAKRALSKSDETQLEFRDPPLILCEKILRTKFEEMIDDELAAIEAAVRSLLSAAATAVGQIDRVFLTGGSSLVPAVQNFFVRLFGREKLRGGEELTSVARGLALLTQSKEFPPA